MNCTTFSALLALAFSSFANAAEPAYANDFQSAEVGKPPKDFLIISGAFLVQQEGANKFLELPGSPLDTYGALFGPAQIDGLSATAKFFGTKTGRKFPAFGLSLNGAGGYRLQVSAAKKQLEIFKSDESRLSVPFEWPDGTWLSLRIQARKTPAGAWIIEGHAWPAAVCRAGEMGHFARGKRRASAGPSRHLGQPLFRHSDPIRRPRAHAHPLKFAHPHHHENPRRPRHAHRFHRIPPCPRLAAVSRPRWRRENR